MCGVYARTRVSWLALLVIALGLGCSQQPEDRPPLAPVSGKVTYKGKPVEGATVGFHGEKSPRIASGKTDAEGRYTLTMFEPNDGAVIGDNAVTVSKPKAAAAATASTTIEIGGEAYSKAMDAAAVGSPVESELPAIFASPSNSGLTRKVVAGPNTIDLVLE